MSAVLALVARQLRDARITLIVALLANALLLGGVHAWFPLPVAVAEASVFAVGALAVLWTLYFTSDAFASDSASGRLATEALLPISARTLWLSRVTFVALAALAQVAAAVVTAALLQRFLGNAPSLEHFEAALSSLAIHWPALAVLGAAGLLGSLVVESALAAMLTTLLLLAGIGLAGTVAGRALILCGVDVEPSMVQARWMCIALAIAFLMLGAFAFERGQRRLGSRSVRALHIGWPIGALLLVGGVATAAERGRRLSVELENPRLRYLQASANSNGRTLALEVQHDLPGNDDPPPIVWLLDLDSGARELIARPGSIERDRYVHSALEWTDSRPLRVVATDSLVYSRSVRVLDVRSTPSSWEVTTRAEDVALEERWLSTRILPAWAKVERIRRGDRDDTTIVHWTERALSARFDGGFGDTVPGGAILPTPMAGLVLARRGDSLVLHSIESGEERAVIANGVLGRMWPSPSGSAVIVSTERATSVLDAATGSPLHEPWPRDAASVQWVDSSDDARVVAVRPFKEPSQARIVDLDGGSSFEIPWSPTQPLLHRVATRGYVYVRADGDLVLVDFDGRFMKVLVDR